MQGQDEIRAAFDAAETVPPVSPEAPGAADPGGAGGPVPPVDLDECPEARAARLPLNDFGNGCRLVEYFGADILFVPRLGWYRWDGKRWAADEDELAVRRDAQKIARKIKDEIDFLVLEPWEMAALDLGRDTADDLRALRKRKSDDLSDAERERLAELKRIETTAEDVKDRQRKARAAHRAHARNSGNSGKITNMLQEAKTAVSCGVGDLNADPLALNCENGVLRLVCEVDPHAAEWGQSAPDWQVILEPHAREQRISKLVPVAYDPAAPCPAFRAFLERIQPDPEIRDFLQRWFGYCLTGETSEQKLAFFYGAGRNGKSTLVDVIAKILADYGTTIPIETLTGAEQRKGSDATPDLVRLPGARFVRASEPEHGQRMKEALIKALTGGEAIMIRRMMQEFVEVVPEFKLTISGNARPEIRGADDGIWRRVMLVPFDQQISKAEVDRGLPAKLWAERAGILAWMVEGLIKWRRDGLTEPESVLAATDEYRQESDPMRHFLQTECDITGSPEDWERARDICDAFNAWLIDRLDGAWGSRTTSNRLKERAGHVKGAGGQVFTDCRRSDTGYSGIRLRDEARNRIAKYGDEIRAAAARKG